MTNTQNPTEDVSSLLAERQRYEDWLAALDSRREATPKHVYDRVRTDYETRLQAVLDRMSRHRSELEQQVKRLAERISVLQSQERAKRDERAELELRAHVGELSADGYREAIRALDDALSAISGEQGALSSELARTREFLTGSTRTAAAPATPHAPPPAAPPAPRPAPPSVPRQNFDEIAFLNSVVGNKRTSAPEPRPNGSASELDIMRDEASTLGESLLSRVSRSAPNDFVRQEPIDALNGPAKRGTVGSSSSMAANVTGNNPIVLRPEAEQATARTLKCAECGSMNYPTEWYCERCGAELASL